MSAPSLPRLFAAVAAALTAVVVTGLGHLPAANATTTISPGQAMVDLDVTLTFRTAISPVDLTTGVTSSIPEQLTPLACGAPDGWTCQFDPGSVTWSRGTSLGSDDTFTLAVHTPDEPGDVTFTISDVRASGATSTSQATLTIFVPEPTETETASEEPTEAEPEPTSQEPAPPLEPFRPPSGEGTPPISIRDLPSDADNDAGVADPLADRVVPKSPLAVETILIALVLALLATSAAGFTIARANR